MKRIKDYIKLLLNYYKEYGIYGIILFVKIVHGFSEKIELPGIKYPFAIRKNTSDKHVFRQIFVEKQYDIDFIKFPENIIDIEGGKKNCLKAIMKNGCQKLKI